MRNASLRAWHAAVLFAVLSFCAASAFAQDPQASPTPSPAPATDPTTATDDANPAPAPDAALPDRLDLDTDTDSADLPAFFKGSIDTEDYLRMRNAHIRRLRGLMDREFSPRRRNGAISDVRVREQQLKQAASQNTAISRSELCRSHHPAGVAPCRSEVVQAGLRSDRLQFPTVRQPR